MNKFFTFLGILALILSLGSCTNISASKVPGKQAAEFPQELIGTYSLEYPEDFQGIMELDSTGQYQTTIRIEKDKLIEEDSDGTRVLPLGDSIYYSTVGNSVFLTLGPNPNYTILKLKKEGNDVLLYAMYTYEEVTPADLKKFATKVKEEKVVGADGTDAEDIGMSNYVLTFKDKKLDAFFESKYASQLPFRLIKQ